MKKSWRRLQIGGFFFGGYNELGVWILDRNKYHVISRGVKHFYKALYLVGGERVWGLVFFFFWNRP